MTRWPLASLRSYLHVITLAAVLPLALLTAWLVSRQVGLAKHQLAMGLEQGATSLALMIEREQAVAQVSLQSLADDSTLQRRDLAGFRRMLRAFMAAHPDWVRVSLIAPGHGAVVSTTQTLEQAEHGDLTVQLLHESTPSFSGLLPGSQPNEWHTRVVVPVIQEGEVRYVLAGYIAAEYWQKLINSAAVAEDRFVSLYDAASTTIARSRAPQEHVGRPLPQAVPSTADGTPPATEGFRKIEFEDHTVAYVTSQRVPISNWGVRMGVDAHPLDRENLMALLAAIGAGLMSLAAGLILSRVVALRITKPLGVLAQGGAARLHDDDITVFEIAMLRNAMHSAEQQRDLARQRLLAKASEFETLFLLSPIGLSITVDPACEEVWRNPAKIAMFDMGPGGKRDFDVLVDGHVIPTAEYPLQRAARGEHISNLEMEVHHHDGRVLRILAHAVPLLNALGKPRGAIATFVDITEQIQSKTKLLLAQSRLEDSQHFVELAQKAGDVGFFDYAVPANRVTMTSGLALLSGLGDSEVATTWEGWLAHLDTSDREAINAYVTQAWHSREELITFKLRLRGLPERARWLSCRAACMYDDGRPIRMVGAVVDVTAQQEIELERSRLMAQEQAARQAAEQANRAKDEFLAVLGHELRNPLGAIAAGIEVLNRISPPNDQTARVRTIITRQTRHLARLMDDLLDVARIIAGKIQLSLAPVSLAGTVQRLVNTFKIAGMEQDLIVDVDDLWVHADTLRLDQIINNLITNASKYCQPDTPIRIIGRRHGDKARLQVVNHGPGIPPALLPHIFDLFVQGERTIERRQGGLGIGLTLVKSLVDLHHGHIEASSEDGRNVFTVDLPLAPRTDVRPTEEAAVPPVHGRKVLIIEDNDDARETVRMMLEVKGHDVEARADSHAGLDALLTLKPQLALVDIGLPGLSGYEVARRARDGGYDGWLVALSGYGQQQDVQRALDSGFDVHMVKPLDENLLDRYLAKATR